MFLGPNQKVTVGELLKGLAVASGNDAAVAIAHHVAGSVEDFVYLMNREATRLGLDSCTFHDPAGLSAHNTITARDFAEFCKIYIELHPETLQELHSVKKITYPTKENITADYAPSHVTQYNRNRLLWEYPEVDGLKTGYIHESGYNIAVSAKKNGMRLVAVLLGGNGRSSSEGQHNLARDAKALLDYSFNNYITLRPRHTSLPSVRVWKGKESAVELAIEEELTVTISKQLRDRLETSYNVRESVEAPVEKGDPLGEIVVSAGDKEIKRVDLIASQAVERGNFFKRLRDTILLLF
jgi:D-alanyl-D-alanine carboxypeptidase (penicillin-binding protein 5/6)